MILCVQIQIPWPSIQLDKLSHGPLMAMENLPTLSSLSGDSWPYPRNTADILADIRKSRWEVWAPGLYCMCSLGVWRHTPTGIKTWILEILWLSLQLGHPRSNFVKVRSGPSRTAKMLCLLSCLQLGPACPSMGPLPVLPHYRSWLLLVSVALSEGSYFCCLFNS